MGMLEMGPEYAASKAQLGRLVYMASLVEIGVRDDPVSLEAIDVLRGAAPADA